MIKIEWKESLDKLPRVRISRSELSVPEEIYGPIQSVYLTGRGKARENLVHKDRFKKPVRKKDINPEEKGNSQSK